MPRYPDVDAAGRRTMRSPRISMARPQGRRGAGLGNEIFALAKAEIAADVLDAEVVEQPWWLNPRRYGPDLGRNAGRPVLALLRGMTIPFVRLGTDDLLSVFDYRASMEHLAQTLPDRWLLLHESGMAGGYLGIRSARGFLQRRLGVLAPPPSAAGVLRVGIHYRAVDFSSEPVGPGVFNARLSPLWVRSAMAAVASSWDGDVRFILHTDASPDDPVIGELTGGLGTSATLRVNRGRVLDDLRSLASCDVVIPSVSSFSMLAIFLSDSLYLWPREQLAELDGWLSIWGTDDRVAEGPMADHIAAHVSGVVPSGAPRGLPYSFGEGPDLSDWLSRRGNSGDHPLESDLIYYGVVKPAL